MKVAAVNVSDVINMFDKLERETNNNVNNQLTHNLAKRISTVSNSSISLVPPKNQQKELGTQSIQQAMMSERALPEKNRNMTTNLCTTNHSKSEMESSATSNCDINSRSVKNTNEEHSKSKILKNGIPKSIHFAWEGENISEMNLANVLLNAMLAPDFSVNIWTNKPSSILSTLDKMSNSEANAQYRFLARKFGPSISINETKELYDELKSHLKNKEKDFGNITNGQFLSSMFSRETNGIYTNYAAASDMTRAALMYLKGGCYMDVDVVCRSLPQLESKEIKHGYLIGKSGSTLDVCNALLVSLPKSEISRNILEQMAYELMFTELGEKCEEDDKMTLWVTKRSNQESRQYDTMAMTGPVLFCDMSITKKQGIFLDADVLFRQKIAPQNSISQNQSINEMFFSNFKKGFNGEGDWVSIDSTRFKNPVTI